jgi:GT2 family glycosyltransferase
VKGESRNGTSREAVELHSSQPTRESNKEESMMGKPAALSECTLVICTRDRLALLGQLLALVNGFGFREIVVVDNAPQHSARSLVEHYGAKYVLEPRPGVSRTRNAGARSAAADFVLFLDDDALPGPGWPYGMLAEFADPRVAMSVGRVSFPPEADARMQCLYDAAGYADTGDKRKVVNRQAPGWYVTANFEGIGVEVTMALRKSVLESWGGFDERIGMGTTIAGHEGQRAFYKLIALGWSVVYTPAAIVHHPAPQHAQARALERITAATGAVLLSLCEDCGHRMEVWRHLCGKSRSGTRDMIRGKIGLTRYQILLARARGILAYMRILVPQGRRRSDTASRILPVRGALPNG